MSNIAPQKPGFNRGIWKNLEAQVRHWAETEEEIIMVTGAILPKEPKLFIKLPKKDNYKRFGA